MVGSRRLLPRNRFPSSFLEQPEEFIGFRDWNLQSLFGLLARLAFSGKSLVAFVCHNASILHPMTIDLSECLAKVERAHEHRDTLQSIVTPFVLGNIASPGSFPEADLVQLSAKLDPESGYHIFRVATTPDERLLRVGVVLGDVVHNLRSALDYLFWALSCRYLGVAKTQRMYKQVQFPIEDGSQGLANKRVHFNKIPQSHWAIIDDAQPYQRPNPPNLALGMLRDLSNRDKHQALNPTLLRPQLTHFYDRTLAARATTDFVFPNAGRYALGGNHLEIGTEVVRVGLPEEVDAEVEMAGYIAPDVLLPEGRWIPAGGWRIIFGAGVMVRTVQKLVQKIETLP